MPHGFANRPASGDWMGVTALIMAGGKGSRMAISEEKPLLKVGGKPVILYVLTALREARKVDSIVVAVSDRTPLTARLMNEFPVTVINTPGKEYVSDMGYAIKKLKLKTVLAIGADLPLITGELIDTILERYRLCRKSALTVVVPKGLKRKLGMSTEYAFEIDSNRIVVPAGINVIDGKEIDKEEMEQEICLLDDKRIAVNVNTQQELEMAENLFSKITQK